jgi:hypothetical protein
MVIPFGFSVAHTRVAGWPDWTVSGCAVKLTIRAGGTTRAGLGVDVDGDAGVWPGAADCPSTIRTAICK